jgi:hypothetical protein
VDDHSSPGLKSQGFSDHLNKLEKEMLVLQEQIKKFEEKQQTTGM